jgi:mannan endo-1,4-beta-mannosidase
MDRRLAGVVAGLAGLVLATAAAGTALAHGTAAAAHSGFVTRSGSNLKLGGATFRFGGTNNYYLTYKSPAMVDDVLGDAATAKFTVVRTWGFLDIGNADGSGSVGSGKADGVYFQYWDGTRPAYNDGPDGLQHLDHAIAEAGELGLKLIIPLTNNWSDFGGMDQYVRWAGKTHHDDFYTDPTIRGWYAAWISHVLNHVNSVTGVAYKNDPTIMTWELANEPRCKGSGGYAPSGGCTTRTLTGWADEMSRHLKSIDAHHLTSVGDEGFFCDDPAATDWTVNCGEGVDTVALAKLPAVDVMSYHLYPGAWGKSTDWATGYIKRHSAEAKRIGKAVSLGEFGYLDKATRNPVYQRWTDAVTSSGGNGFLYWILSGTQDDGTRYPDYDGFTVYCPSPVCTAITNATDEIRHGHRSRAPVADDDTATTQTGTPVTLTPAANDIAYSTKVVACTIDLDPSAAGRQASVTVAGGRFVASPAGSVVFTPADGFQGRATGHYTIKDKSGRTSNVADLAAAVKPKPGEPAVMSSFETGTEGWAPGSWQANAGSVSQTADFHTNGSYGLHVAATGGGWFGVTLDEPIDLSGHAALKYDLRTGADAGTSASIAVEYGDGYTWCQSAFNWVPQNQNTTVTADLTTDMSCDPLSLTQVHAVFVYFGPGGFDLDNVRAE